MKRYPLVILGILFAVFAHSQAIDKSLLEKHVCTLSSDSLMGRGFGARGGRMAADYIIEQFTDAGILPWNGNYRHEFISSGMTLTSEGCNIVGWVEGSDPTLKDEYIVVGGHYDHVAYKMDGENKVVFNGADDNASGTAAIIELGRWLVANKDLLKRSVILVAFDGEEAGLIGSTYMVYKNQIPINKVKIMFSLDMVGMLSKYGGIDLFGNSTLQSGALFMNELAAKHGIKVKKQGKRVQGKTDTAPFGYKGIPAVHVFTSTVSPYHKPEDDAHLLDYEGMVSITNFMTDVVVELSTRETLMPNRRFVAKMQDKWYSPDFGFNVGFGNSHHNYKSDFFIGKEVFAAQAGFFMQVKFTKTLSLQPELIYRTVGSKHADGELRTHEVTVPVNLRARLIPKAKSGLTPDLFVVVGPYYSHKFSGKVGKNEMNFQNTFYEDEKGIQYGIGFEMMRIQMVSSIQRSLTSIDRTKNVIPISYTFNIGFKF